jgi:hypothetical protein
MASNPLVGVWRLVSYHSVREDGHISYPWGQDVAGFITYTDLGYMSVVFTKADRPRISLEGPGGGTVEEKVQAFETCTAYAGTYDYTGTHVIHHVKVSSTQNWVGTDLVRRLEIDGNRVSLVSEPMHIGRLPRTYYLVWERVPNA